MFSKQNVLCASQPNTNILPIDPKSLLKNGNLAETLRRNYVGKVSHGGCVCAGAAWEKLCGGEHTGWRGEWGGRRRRVCVCVIVCFKWGSFQHMCMLTKTSCRYMTLLYK